MTVNKSDLIDLMSKEKGWKKYEAKIFIEDFFDVLAKHIAAGDKISIQNFGNFEIKKKKGHPAVHPRTGEKVVVEDYKDISFKPSANLLGAMRAINV